MKDKWKMISFSRIVAQLMGGWGFATPAPSVEGLIGALLLTAFRPLSSDP